MPLTVSGKDHYNGTRYFINYIDDGPVFREYGRSTRTTTVRRESYGVGKDIIYTSWLETGYGSFENDTHTGTYSFWDDSPIVVVDGMM